ncbi:MAG: hypothetical protein IID48_07650 [Proteobacteria bacterium]|nr:hypothetical protein [Pseudomonadota bacterium]
MATYWYENFMDEVSSNDKILKDQAVCFFHLIEGAGLGTLRLGRRGAPTRIEYDRAAIDDWLDRLGDRDVGGIVDHDAAWTEAAHG